MQDIMTSDYRYIPKWKQKLYDDAMMSRRYDMFDYISKYRREYGIRALIAALDNVEIGEETINDIYRLIDLDRAEDNLFMWLENNQEDLTEEKLLAKSLEIHRQVASDPDSSLPSWLTKEQLREFEQNNAYELLLSLRRLELRQKELKNRK